MDTWKISEKVIKTLPMPMIVVDNTYKAIIINQGFKSLFAKYKQTMRRGQYLESILSKDMKFYRKLTNEIKDIEEETFFEYSIEDRFYKITITKVTDYFSPKYCILLQDITVENEVEVLRRKFISNVAHELRTPLTAMSSHAELMAYHDNLETEEIRKYSKVMYKEVQRLSKMVNQLLDITKYEQHKIALYLETFCIDEMIDELKLIYPKKNSDHNVKLDMISNGYELKADYDRLKQVMINLIDNAYSYTKDKIEIEVKEKNDKLRISVIDNGVGLTVEQQEKVFERFYRTDDSRDRNSGGTGLGLSIVDEIVSLHGGKVYVQSEIGIGTEFILELPVSL